MIATDILDRAAAQLYSGLLSDACDRLGLVGRVVEPGLRPAWSGATLCGNARIIHSQGTGWQPISPYARQIEALDALGPDDLVVATVGNDPGCGLWGELFSTAARARGARGTLVDGNIRDTDRITAMRFPVFGRGYSPLDSLGRVEVVPDITSVTMGGVEVRNGDLVFGDIDGVVIVPEAHAAEVLRLAFEKHDTEDTMRDELRAGSLLRDAFARHRVL
ncbi:MAG: RraA family protein [Chloroflexi bacterium]|nr:RraA family protein [Chloroflexota bacterium]